jgi:hypothetical protein
MINGGWRSLKFLRNFGWPTLCGFDKGWALGHSLSSFGSRKPSRFSSSAPAFLQLKDQTHLSLTTPRTEACDAVTGALRAMA